MLEFEWENLDLALLELVDNDIRPVIRGLVCATWNSILVKTPQYHGRLVASWSFSIDAPEFVDRSNQVPNDPLDGEEGPRLRYRGHPAAISIANSYARGKENSFMLGDTVWFANGADHGEGAYSSFIENVDSNYLRQFNRPGHAVSRTIDMIHAKYSYEISPSEANRLKQTKIGGSS